MKNNKKETGPQALKRIEHKLDLLTNFQDDFSTIVLNSCKIRGCPFTLCH